MPSFGPVAPFYEELMHVVPYHMWVSYYLLLLSVQEVKPKRHLEACCGTGTCSRLLYEEGFQVEGFDLSPEMITEARRLATKAAMPIRFEVADVASFDMGRTYESVFCFFDSFNYVTDPQDLQNAFHQIYKHLEPGGSFIFDLNTEYAFVANLFDQKQLSKKAPVRYLWQGNYSKETRLIEVDMTFWYQGAEYHETHVQRAYTNAEIRGMLDIAGFTEVKCYHSYTLEAPRKNSDRVHYISRKRI